VVVVVDGPPVAEVVKAVGILAVLVVAAVAGNLAVEEVGTPVVVAVVDTVGIGNVVYCI